jgi:pSer/pThr/pTyr-binding forkhead associated (FHA) protein
MKLSLTVLTAGKMEGKSIPVPHAQFLIGRDPQCHLRPASALISKRHCALLVRGNQAFVRDFDSTNGTFVNGEAIKGERELQPDDCLKVGPLDFRVVLGRTAPVNKPTPVPAPAGPAGAPSDDETAAALLLSLGDDSPEPGSSGVDSQGIPTGSTVMDILAPAKSETPSPDKENPAGSEGGKGGADRSDKAKAAEANTSSAAKAILEKYMRRPRR